MTRWGLDGAASQGLVLIVDDAPDNLSMLHDALDAAGYTVLVATRGEQALARAAQAQPDVILLDAIMPGMDGFACAQQLKAQPLTRHIPIIFMTGLTESEHVVRALGAGCVDYVTKPVRADEVLARMQVHVASARAARTQTQQALAARSALDAFGYASMTVRVADGRVLWQTTLAREMLARSSEVAAQGYVSETVRSWMLRHQADLKSTAEPPRLVLPQPTGQLVLRLHQPHDDAEGESAEGQVLVVMREESGTVQAEVLREAFALTAKEAEVLYWVAQGKINRDIADIVGSSPATVKKHLERVHAKLGVETRTAAAAMALAHLR